MCEVLNMEQVEIQSSFLTYTVALSSIGVLLYR